jgi:hypothetical protein
MDRFFQHKGRHYRRRHDDAHVCSTAHWDHNSQNATAYALTIGTVSSEGLATRLQAMPRRVRPGVSAGHSGDMGGGDWIPGGGGRRNGGGGTVSGRKGSGRICEGRG